jgi:ABC-type Fe3+-siderophore transport system permease subunit
MTAILESGYAFWNPIILIIVFIVVMIVVYFFRRRGQKGYKQDTDQARIFLCGEEVPEAEQRHVRAGNIYWGFFETFKEYYNQVLRPHTGIINDYILWFVAVMAISAIILLIAGLR